MIKALISICLMLLTVTGFADQKQQPKVYDCFMFFNEVELLEIRLNELYDYVDKFVLVESCETHRSAQPKPFYFDDCKDRFTQFEDKIVHVKLEDKCPSAGAWTRENWQRNQIMRGLTGCQQDDIIMISDVDEIVPGALISQLGNMLDHHQIVVCSQQMYRWFLNRSCRCEWLGTGIVRYHDLLELTPQGVRHAARTRAGGKVSAGWHFTSMGGYQKILEKYQSIVEGYDGDLSPHAWKAQVEDHLLVPIDETYPRFVQDNLGYMIDQNLIDTSN